jgi:hypothetical protein
MISSVNSSITHYFQSDLTLPSLSQMMGSARKIALLAIGTGIFCSFQLVEGDPGVSMWKVWAYVSCTGICEYFHQRMHPEGPDNMCAVWCRDIAGVS